MKVDHNARQIIFNRKQSADIAKTLDGFRDTINSTIKGKPDQLKSALSEVSQSANSQSTMSIFTMMTLQELAGTMKEVLEEIKKLNSTFENLKKGMEK